MLFNTAAYASSITITTGGKEFSAVPDDNVTAREIFSHLPLSLELGRYADHEYSGALNFKPEFAPERTSHILAGHLYYWDGWNVFVINYEDYNISPYKVVHIGTVNDASGICEYLRGAEDKITVEVKEGKILALSEFAEKYHAKMFPGYKSKFRETDPEFIERFDNFAFDEVINTIDLDDKSRFMAILATLLGCQGIDEFKAMLPAAMEFGVTPVEIREIVYQSVAYLGIGRVFPFLKAMNECFTAKGITLPLEPQSTTTTENRREAGTQAQVDIFGEGMRDFWKGGHINLWLAGNCFGDYYTRKGLNYAQREMITFCFLAAQGGCEPQLTAHAVGNMKVGNDKDYLIKIVSQCLPFIGYPRSLNAIGCVNEAAKQFEEAKN